MLCIYHNKLFCSDFKIASYDHFDLHGLDVSSCALRAGGPELGVFVPVFVCSMASRGRSMVGEILVESCKYESVKKSTVL